MQPSATIGHPLAVLTLVAAFGACTPDDGTSAAQGEGSTTTTEDSSGSAVDAADETATTGIEGDFEPDCEGAFEITEPDPNFTWTPLSIRLASEQLSPGVFAVYDERAAQLTPEAAALATSGGFIIGDDGVLLVESMINQQLTCQMYDLVREQTSLPIRYIVNTSHHGDHSYGNHFHGADTQIVQHRETAAFVAEHFDADRDWMISNFGANQGMEEVEPRAADIEVGQDGWAVDLGGVTVEAHDFGFAQTHGDLWIWLPEQRVLWTGNAQVTRNPGLPWLLDGRAQESVATMRAVREFVPAGATVIPGHDTPQTTATFDFTIDYLDTLLVEVQAAVDDGLTLEETIAAVTMDEFRGYVLFDWVHPQINVTSTYADLTAD
ncbi:MAG: MBL fold metallo-hydrolase [Deltaproteobacteria bacterium]|nr:MBL fold metallo-hydrolase [Deltaproteobacteria bacterium]